MKLGMRELLFLMVMLGVLGSSYFLIFSKANARRDELVRDTQMKQQTLDDLRAATMGVSDLNKRIDQLQTAIKFFDSKLPPQRDVDTILKQITEICQKAGLVIKTVKPHASETTSNYSEEPIELMLTGDYQTGFYQFMLDLENLPRLTRVTQMRLTKLADHEGHTTADVTLSIYFAPDMQSSASAQ